MATIKYKDSSEVEHTVTFESELGVIITVDSDTAQYTVTTTSPTISTTTEFIGGRPSRK